MASFSEEDRKRIEARAAELVTLHELRMAVQKTQKQMAQTLGVRQDTISRLENRSDMLLSTLRRYVEGMGGTLELVALFPDRPPMVIHRLGEAAAHST
ncbi:MAG: XRE family transcriptional regulator [Rhodocyclaceae bacterium]|nr:XRE family transcriptional regulator [Rhodocyclaceae bacterium]